MKVLSQILAPLMALCLTCVLAIAGEHVGLSEAQNLASRMEAAVHVGGPAGVEPFAAEAEKTLLAAGDSVVFTVSPEHLNVLADGLAEAAVAGKLIKDQHKENLALTVSVLPNPYPRIGLYLGLYYNAIRKPKDALRALNAGIKLSLQPEPEEGSVPGGTLPSLVCEMGYTLMQLHRVPAALRVYEDGLKYTPAADHAADRACLLRGQGYLLMQMGLLDKAEQVYRQSLVLDPGNDNAEKELSYIATMRTDVSNSSYGLR